MEVEEENTENLIQFWNLLNEMLQEVSGEHGMKFNPSGFIADEHHANWRSINAVFGESVLQRTFSCEFHYKQSVQRHAKRIGLGRYACDTIRYVSRYTAHDPIRITIHRRTYQIAFLFRLTLISVILNIA